MGVRSIARALGLSPSRVSTLAKQGMPVDDLAAATRWRDMNLDPRWMPKEAPPPPHPCAPALHDLAHRLLRHEVPRRHWRPEILALAAREAGIQATPAQVLEMACIAVLLWMDATDRALGDDKGRTPFELPDELTAKAGSPEHAALMKRLGELMTG